MASTVEVTLDDSRLKGLIERAQDFKPIARQWGAYLRALFKGIIETGEGIAPRAGSTAKKREHTYNSAITTHGKVRASYARKLVKLLRRKGNADSADKLRRVVADNFKGKTAWNPAVNRLQKQLARFHKAHLQLRDLREQYGDAADSAPRGANGRFLKTQYGVTFKELGPIQGSAAYQKKFHRERQKVERLASRLQAQLEKARGKTAAEQSGPVLGKVVGAFKVALEPFAVVVRNVVGQKSGTPYARVLHDGGRVGNGAVLPPRPWQRTIPEWAKDGLQKIALDWWLRGKE